MGAALVMADPAPGYGALLRAIQAQMAEVISGNFGPKTTVAERGEAMEAVGRGQPLTARQAQALMDLGIAPRDLTADQDRPWGEADRVTILRLASVRGWSALAISVFVQRPEARVAAILGGAWPKRAVRGVRAPHLRRSPVGCSAARWSRKGGIVGR